jgi:hypothetical protein
MVNLTCDVMRCERRGRASGGDEEEEARCLALAPPVPAAHSLLLSSALVSALSGPAATDWMNCEWMIPGLWMTLHVRTARFNVKGYALATRAPHPQKMKRGIF